MLSKLRKEQRSRRYDKNKYPPFIGVDIFVLLIKAGVKGIEILRIELIGHKS